MRGPSPDDDLLLTVRHDATESARHLEALSGGALFRQEITAKPASVDGLRVWLRAECRGPQTP